MYRLEDQIEFGCSIGDVICMAFESQARGMGEFLGWLAKTVLGSQKFAPGTTLWNSAIGEASHWMGIAIIVMMATGIIGLSTGMLSMKPKRVFASIAGICAAIPSTYLSIALGGELLSISDQMSNLTLDRLGGSDGFQNLFRAISRGGTGNDLAGAAMAIMSGGTAQALPTLLMLVLVIIGLVLMSFALAFRNLGLMVLIAFAPLAFMAVPMKGSWEIPKKWAAAGIALLLSKPLMFGVLAMLLKASDGMALFSPQTLTVVTGLFMVSFMPMAAYSFFSFMGASNENMAGQQVAGAAAQKASQPVRQAGNIAINKGASAAFGGKGGGGKSLGGGKSQMGGNSPGGGKSQGSEKSQGNSKSQGDGKHSGTQTNSQNSSNSKTSGKGGQQAQTGSAKPISTPPSGPKGNTGSPTVPAPSSNPGGTNDPSPKRPSTGPRW